MTATPAHPPKGLTRREFLALCALSGALPAALAACQSGPSPVGQATPVPSRVASPSPRPVPTEADWSALASSLQGTLIRPNSPQYPIARQLFDPRFDSIQPAAIASCVSPGDVQRCLAFGRQFSVSLALRSGGHSFAGYSTTTGLVIDVTHINAVSVDANAGTATIGAGARLIDVYATLAQDGLALPAGSCPSVGIAGLTLGGGVGVLGRKFGLTCDNLLSAQVVVADGRLLTCDAGQHADLFWALRGGGGGNFGVVTQFTFQAHPVSTLTLFTINWPWGAAADMLDAWQHWAPQAPDELWSNCLLISNNNQRATPLARVNGVYVGDESQLDGLLQQLIGQISVAPASRYVSQTDLLDAMLVEANCDGQTVNQCHLPSQDPQGQVPRVTAGARSDYFTTLLPQSGIDALVNAIERRQTSALLGGGGIGIDSYGGAINRVAPDATAFVHRSALFSAQYSANWNASDPDARIAANQSWLADTWQAMRPYASGASYQNYIDPDLTDWQQAYYGANLARLRQVKAAYDPSNLFQFAQSIPPASNS
jgi:FAD/FMN-containing dehydrogenase